MTKTNLLLTEHNGRSFIGHKPLTFALYEKNLSFLLAKNSNILL